MKKSVKTISAILLCLVLISMLVSCSQSDVPEGYQLIACEGDCFRLYVPTQWVVNTSSGVTSAYYSSVENASVSVSVVSDAGDMTPSEYWAICHERYALELNDYVHEDKQERVAFGGQAAEKHVFSATVTSYSEEEQKVVSVAYKFMQIFARYNGKMYLFTFTATAERYDELIETVEGNSSDEGIIPYFRFAEPYVSEDGEKEISDKVTAPEGMKLASTEARPYRLFIPKDWKINNRTDATAAYASDTESANVNVQIYSMTQSGTETIEQHWEKLETSYKKMFVEYTLISDEKIEIDGSEAHKYTYILTSGDTEYKLVQAIVKRGETFYTVTCTAIAEEFDSHAAEFDKMIENFDIR